jgi:hypothetical protein
MIQIQFSMLEEALHALKTAAAKKGITPNILARLILHERFLPTDTDSKSYTLTVNNWKEIEAYVEEKQLASVEVLARFAMKQYMTKYPPKTSKKRQGGETIEN